MISDKGKDGASQGNSDIDQLLDEAQQEPLPDDILQEAIERHIRKAQSYDRAFKQARFVNDKKAPSKAQAAHLRSEGHRHRSIALGIWRSLNTVEESGNGGE